MKNKFLRIFTLIMVIVLSLTAFGCREGESAYEIAVKNGFSGTEKQWLESLKGADGLDGRDGQAGKDGENAENITIEDIYQTAVNHGYDKDFLTFIKEYFSGSFNEYNTEVAIHKALLSAVDIISTFNVRNTVTNVIEDGHSAGSGVIYSLDKENGNAIVLTNYHVVYNAGAYGLNKIAKSIKLYLFGSELEAYAIPATYVGGSLTYDIAVLSIENSEVLKNSAATAVTIKDSNLISVGETAIVIGNSDGAGISATVGRISVDSEYITMKGADEVTTVTFRSIRIDAAVNPGNSGGGLYNAAGELIGIVNAKTVKEDVEGMAYAVPSTIAVNVAENIMWNATGGRTGVSKGLMGVQVKANESKAVYDEQTQKVKIVETVTVDMVTEGALVDGVLQPGDVFVSIEHNGVISYCTRMFIVVDYMLKVRPGDQITVTFIRNGETMQHTFTLESKHFTNII